MVRYKSIGLVCSLLLLFGGLTARAQQVTAEAYWDTNGVDLGSKAQITLGDQLNLVISVSGATVPQVSFPGTDELNQNDLVVISQHLDTLQRGGQYLLRCLTVMTSFEVGDHSTGLLQLTVMNGGNPDLLTVDSLLLTVADVPNVDTASLDIKDIAPIVKEPYTFWEIFRWILAAILIVVAVWGAVLLSRKIKRREPIITLPQAPPVPADEKALEQLEELRLKGLWQAGKAKAYHTELTDIVREYLYNQYGIESAEMTTEQTLAAFRNCRGWDADSETLLRQILQTADQVKFAKHEPLPYEHDLSMKNACNFVRACAGKKEDLGGGSHQADLPALTVSTDAESSKQ